eukprot:654815-Rhodomonas_salina.1
MCGTEIAYSAMVLAPGIVPGPPLVCGMKRNSSQISRCDPDSPCPLHTRPQLLPPSVPRYISPSASLHPHSSLTCASSVPDMA